MTPQAELVDDLQDGRCNILPCIVLLARVQCNIPNNAKSNHNLLRKAFERLVHEHDDLYGRFTQALHKPRLNRRYRRYRP